MSKKHHRYSPSATSRWINCPGSIALSKGIASETSIYAAEGTAAHDIAEQALLNGAKACVLTEDEDTAAAVQAYLDEIEFVRATHEVIAEHTEKMHECSYINGLGGTPDHIMLYIDDGKVVLHDFDYKHGVGVPVSAEENMQILSYFVILEDNYPGLIDEFRATIVQPRAFTGDKLQTWSCGPDRVAAHAKQIQIAQQQDHLAAGDWCRWCPAMMICPEVQRHAREIAQTEFSEIDTETLLYFESIAPAVQAFLNKIPTAMLNKFKAGEGIPGKKVIATLSHRRWRSTQMAQEQLESLGIEKSAFIEEKLRTPPQVEKLLPKEQRKALETLVHRVPVGFKIVPESAKGEPIDFSVSEFTVIEDDE